MLVWDFNNDVVTPGQWLRGRVYTKRCDISPDGRHVVIAATNYSKSHREKNKHPIPDPESEMRRTRSPFSEPAWVIPDESLADGWTAVSRPPYFTAVALWFSGGAWNGGGIWMADDDLHLNPSVTWHEAVAPPSSCRVERLGGIGRSEDEPIFSMRLGRHGWLLVQNDGKASVQKKVFKSGVLRRSFLSGSGGDHWSVLDKDGVVRREWKLKQWSDAQFLDVDGKGRVVFGDRGRLWAWPSFPDGEPVMVADLNGNTFASVPPPDWARCW